MDEYAAARRTAIVRCFIDALTRGGIPDVLRAVQYILKLQFVVIEGLLGSALRPRQLLLHRNLELVILSNRAVLDNTYLFNRFFMTMKIYMFFTVDIYGRRTIK